MTRKADTLHRIEALSARWFGADADRWLNAPHAMLEGDTPAQRIDQGLAEDVLAVLETLETGAYV